MPILLASALGTRSLYAEADRPPPGRTRILVVPQAPVPPSIDGDLSDAAWSRAAIADQFWITDQQRWPTEQTEVLVTSDGRALYFAFKIYDREPEAIEALQTRRDASLGLDDQVAVQLDPFLTRREISTYSVNARGTRVDRIGGGRARQRAWRGDWPAAAAGTDYGWVAEIEIPFEILNFQPGTDRMGVNFLRYHHRTKEWSRWADVTVRNLPEEMGQLIGLRPSSDAMDGPWTFLPYTIVGRNIRDRGGEVDDVSAAAGADIRYQPRSNLTSVVSLFPDFSQVENAVADIDFNYNEKSIAETRPFFQEGSAYFGVSRTYFYPNRIPNFDYGVKGFGRIGSYQFGALVTRSDDEHWDGLLDFRRQIGETHNVSVLAVSTYRPGLNNQLYAISGQGRGASWFNYAFDVAETRTDPPPGDGAFQRMSVGWDLSYWNISLSGSRYAVGFRPENGIVASDLLGTRGLQTGIGYYRDRPEGAIRELAGSLSYEQRTTADGRLQRRKYYAGASAELREWQLKITGTAYLGPYRPLVGAPGEWQDEMNDDRYWNLSLDFNTRSSRFGYGGSYYSGELGGGDYRYIVGYVWARPTRNTFVNVNSESFHNFGSFDQMVATAGWDITPSLTLAARYITAYYGEAYRAAFTWRVRENIDCFVVYDEFPGEPPAASAKIVASF